MSMVIEMMQEMKETIAHSIGNFRLPRYSEIPTVGLYLEQTTKYISEFLDPLQEGIITGSMVSNYVKKGVVSSPVKKQYSRDQIAHLIFIAVTKSVMSLDALTSFIQLQQQTYCVQKAYDYFAAEFENLLLYTFELKDTMDTLGEDSSDEKRLLYSCIVAVTQKVYLEKCLEILTTERAKRAREE